MVKLKAITFSSLLYHWRERMFYESNESMSHESMSQQVGSAVFCTVSAKCRLQAADRVENGN